MVKIDMLSTSIGSCTRRRRNISRQPRVKFRRSPSIFWFEFIRFFEFVSVVEQEKGEKADQDPERWTENSEPKRNIPVATSDDRDFVRESFCSSSHKL